MLLDYKCDYSGPSIHIMHIQRLRDIERKSTDKSQELVSWTRSGPQVHPCIANS